MQCKTVRKPGVIPVPEQFFLAWFKLDDESAIGTDDLTCNEFRFFRCQKQNQLRHIGWSSDFTQRSFIQERKFSCRIQLSVHWSINQTRSHTIHTDTTGTCLLYTSDAADE